MLLPKVQFKNKAARLSLAAICAVFSRCVAEGVRFELTWAEPKRFSRPPRYDHFDNPPYVNCRVADFIGFIKFLDIWLDCLFFCFFGAPTKSRIARGSRVFASDWSTNFQEPYLY